MDFIASFLQDLRLTWRRLARTPRFTWFAVLMLGLALGAHLAIVGVIETVLLKSLPVEEPERLLAVHETRNGDSFRSLAFADYLEYRADAHSFEELAAHYSTAPVHIDLADTTEMVNGAIVSASYFPLLGIEPGRGRFFLPEEDQVRGSHPVVVLSDAMWRTRLEGREDVLGSTVKVNDTALTVVGVAPEGFVGLDASRPCELWMPTMMADVGSRWCDALTDRGCRLFEMIGRLAPDQTLATAQVEMDLLSSRLHAAHDSPGDVERGIEVTPLTGLDSERGRTARRMVQLLLTVVTLVVIVAGANLSGLLMGRGLKRRREIAVRLALGAPRWRVISLFIAEALILAVAGCIGGLMIASWGGPLGSLAFQTRVPVEVEVSPGVMGYAAMLCALIGLFVGLLPGLQVSRPEQVSALKEVAGKGARRSRLLAVFVVVQIAVSFVLLHSTGLLARSLVTITEAPDVDPANIATLRLRPRMVGYDVGKSQALIQEVLERIEALPGVNSVGFGKLRPLWPGFQTVISLPGDIPSTGGSVQTTGLQPIAPRTLESLGMSFLRGRDFDSHDTADSSPVLIVNRSLAESLWPGEDAIGQRVTLRETAYEVIGVVQDSAYHTLIGGHAPQAFSAFWQDLDHPDARFVVRFESEAGPFLPVLRELVDDADPVVPLTELATLEQRLRQDLSGLHVASWLTGVASILAALLGVTGLAGVLALAVAQRVREIGIRKALGASHTQVTILVVRDAMILVGLALGCGVMASRIIEPTLSQFLFEVQPGNPWILGGAFLLLVWASAIATWWPTRQAIRVDPITVLR